MHVGRSGRHAYITSQKAYQPWSQDLGFSARINKLDLPAREKEGPGIAGHIFAPLRHIYGFRTSREIMSILVRPCHPPILSIHR